MPNPIRKLFSKLILRDVSSTTDNGVMTTRVNLAMREWMTEPQLTLTPEAEALISNLDVTGGTLVTDSKEITTLTHTTQWTCPECGETFDCRMKNNEKVIADGVWSDCCEENIKIDKARHHAHLREIGYSDDS